MDIKTIKKDVLGNTKGLITKAVRRALEIVLSPCCNETITSVSYDCGTNQLTVFITPAQPSIAVNGGFAYVFAEGGFLNPGLLSADGKSIVVSSVAEVDVVGITSYSAFLFLPTPKSNENSGAYVYASGLVTPVGPC